MSDLTEAVTLDNCAQEPIHIPGAIQPHGVLLAFRGPSLQVSQVSATVERFLGKKPADVLGQPLGAVLDAASTAHIQSLVGRASLREANPFRVNSAEGRVFDAILHRSGTAMVLELEPSQEKRTESMSSFDPRLRSSVMRLQSAADLQTLTAIAAEEVRSLTGFDRVMIYRFDGDWNGEVVAESKREDLSSFIGQHYPASDIPAQARRLYTVNWLRLIGDVTYQAAPVVPALDPETKAPLDMSFSTLRSVSPIHIEYLRNMGVSASMSISLVIDGQLAGLIACHHYDGPRLVPPAVRDTAEYLGYSLSWQLSVLEGANRAQQARDAKEHEAEVMRSVAVASELLDGLHTPALLALTQANGAAIVLEEGLRKLGQAPSTLSIRTIVAWLRQNAPDAFSTDHLAQHIPEAAGWEDTAAGLSAVAIARELGEYILWFRPAAAKVIKWAGEPVKQVVTPEGKAPRLSPRGSFELWQEVVKGRSLAWEPWQLNAASSLRSALLGGVRKRAVQLRSLNQRLLDADRSKDNFIAMVSHELRTPLTSINGWTTLLKSGRVDPKKTQHALEVIAKNVQSQSQLIEDLLDVSRMTSGKLVLEVQTIDVMSIVASTAEATALAIEAKGIELKRDLDPTVNIVRGDALRLRQVMTNLIANAVKFTPKGGKITVGLRRVESDAEFSVTDTGQGIAPEFLPHVFEAFRQQEEGITRRGQGLGLGLAIARKLVELHGGRITAESDGPGKGSTFRVRLPITPFTASDERPTTESIDTLPAAGSSELAGVRVLVVEDEPDSREIIQSILESCQADVIAAPDARTALVILETERFDIIVSDVGMPDMDGLQFMAELRKRPPQLEKRTPAIALTAFTRGTDRTSALEAGFQSHVPKPVDANELVATIQALLGLPRQKRS